MMKPPPPRTTSQELAAQLPTMPAPMDPRVEPMSSPPGVMLLGDIRAVMASSAAPPIEQAAALEQIRRELEAAVARTSQENLEQDARTGLALAAHDERIERIEKSSAAGASSAGAVEKLLSGVLPPKVVLGIVALLGVAQTIIQIFNLIRGNP